MLEKNFMIEKVCDKCWNEATPDVRLKYIKQYCQVCNKYNITEDDICRKVCDTCWKSATPDIRFKYIDYCVKKQIYELKHHNVVKNCLICKVETLLYKHYECETILCNECSKIYDCECPQCMISSTRYISRKIPCKRCGCKLNNDIDKKYDICRNCETDNISKVYLLYELLNKINPFKLCVHSKTKNSLNRLLSLFPLKYIFKGIRGNN